MSIVGIMVAGMVGFAIVKWCQVNSILVVVLIGWGVYAIKKWGKW